MSTLKYFNKKYRQSPSLQKKKKSLLAIWHFVIRIVIFFFWTGQEYPAIVEFAPFQKAAKKKTKKRDTKVGTIDDGTVWL